MLKNINRDYSELEKYLGELGEIDEKYSSYI